MPPFFSKIQNQLEINMASPQWKNFQPSSPESAVLSYQHSPSFSKSLNSNNNQDDTNLSSSPGGSSAGLRETGIVEKLLHSYGFIQCCERQARLFFHYSQFSGNIEHLKLGDAVEFEMTYDRRTGKPIASAVLKISPEVMSGEDLSEGRVSGFVTTGIKDTTEGRVAYESRGECFFLPYTREDLEGDDVELHPNDKVTFCIASDKNTGNLRARNVRLEKPVPERYQGVICALKETFGFIERADVVKEIFFHSSECKDFKTLNLGDDVEFSIHTRNNKEVAVNITLLPVGTVVFEDVEPTVLVGQITKIIEKDRSRQTSDALPGRIKFHHHENRVLEYPFGERDPKGDYTFQVGDWVQFNLATDRRDSLQRATNIELMNDTFELSGENRKQGIIAVVKDNYGFVKYGSRENRLYFRFSELLNPDETVKPQDEVEFTVAQDPASQGRFQAIRIRVLPPGTIDLDSLNASNCSNKDVEGCLSDDESGYIIGTVEREASSPWSLRSPHKGSKSNGSSTRHVPDENEEQEGSCEEGIICYQKDGAKEKINYTLKDCEARNYPRVGDKVEFSISSQGPNNMHAVGVKVVNKIRNGFRFTHRGFIAALKDSFGFIETEEHDREIFFHYSVYDGHAASLEVGQEVEYALTHKGNKLSAECVRKLPYGSIPGEEVQPEVLNGVVVNPVRCFNPEQENYPGKIRITTDAEVVSENQAEYEFGITSLCDKHEFLQKGDVVQFQVGLTKKGQERAINIKAIRTTVQATVDTIKGNFGFLSYEAEEGKKLFFHMSEVKGGTTLQPGDKVEFVVVYHQRTGKYSACSVVKVGESQPLQRPERLICRLRATTLEDGPRVIVIRQPHGPDGTSGFNTPRLLKEPNAKKHPNASNDIVNGLSFVPDIVDGKAFETFQDAAVVAAN